MTALSLRNPTMFGAVNAVIAVFLFSINDMAIKGLSGGYALHQVILFRSTIAMAFLLAFVVPFSGGWSALRTKRPRMHVLRGILVVLSNVAFFLGLASLPLAEAVAIFFICPLISTLMSMVFLGEKVGPRRWISIVMGLVGVLIIVRPGTSAFDLAFLFPLAAAVAYAGMQNVTRGIGGTESAATLAVSIQVAFILVSLVAGLTIGDGRFADQSSPALSFFFRAWVWPPASDYITFALIGLASAGGGYFTARAYRSADVALIASFEYASLPFSLFWGLVIFGEWPDHVEMAGIALILASGLFLVWRESQTRLK